MNNITRFNKLPEASKNAIFAVLYMSAIRPDVKMDAAYVETLLDAAELLDDSHLKGDK